MDPMISLLRSVVVVPSAFVKHNGLKSLDEAGVIKKFTELTHSFWSSQVASQIAQNILNHKL
jgi:hypothetical protein